MWRYLIGESCLAIAGNCVTGAVAPYVAPHQKNAQRRSYNGDAAKSRKPAADPGQKGGQEDPAATTAQNHDRYGNGKGKQATHVIVSH